MIELALKMKSAKFAPRARRVKQRLEDLRPVWPAVADELDRCIEQVFHDEGGASGQWAALSPEYEKRKHPDHGILRRTDALFTSLTRKFSAKAVFKVRKQGFTRGTKLLYAKFLQGGTKFMPARPIYDLRENHKRRIRSVLRQQLKALAVSVGIEVK